MGLNYFLGTGKSSDLGLDIQYTKSFKKHTLQAGLELRSIDWGNHLGLIIGYQAPYTKKASFLLASHTSLHPGIALFHQAPLGTIGFSHLFLVKWQSKKRSFLQIDMGARYSICPGYKKYGPNSQLEFPLSIKWGLRFSR